MSTHSTLSLSATAPGQDCPCTPQPGAVSYTHLDVYKRQIQGYAASLDPARLGRALQVVVMVRLSDQRQETLAAFEESVVGIEDVLRCSLIAGDADYLLTVQVRDLDSYHALYTERLGDCLLYTSRCV